MNKRGQVTIFIIIGIVIAVGAVLFLTITKKAQVTSPEAEARINVDECIKDSINQALEIIMPQGGFSDPQLYLDYKGRKITYLCYTNLFYKPCIIQVPFLEDEIKNGLMAYSGSKINDCFYALEQDYRDRSYGVESKPMNFSIDILPSKISIIIEKEMIFTKGEERRVYDEFKVNKASSLFYLLMAVHDIVDQEARYCSFDYIGYMLVHPDLEISRINVDTESRVYNMISKKTNEEISFAVRSCAISENG